MPNIKKTNINVKSDNKRKVIFKVSLKDEAKFAKEIFVVGNIPELGNWSVTNGLPLKAKNGHYEASIEVDPNWIIEYKVCNKLDWSGVEKGVFGEEVPNHIFMPNESLIANHEVNRWS